MYKHVHSLHHRSRNTAPWSGLSMHPLESWLWFSTHLVHLVVTSHPVHYYCEFGQWIILFRCRLSVVVMSPSSEMRLKSHCACYVPRNSKSGHQLMQNN